MLSGRRSFRIDRRNGVSPDLLTSGLRRFHRSGTAPPRLAHGDGPMDAHVKRRPARRANGLGTAVRLRIWAVEAEEAHEERW